MPTLAAPVNPALSPHLRADVQALASDLVTWRRHLHQYPELGFQEVKTAAYIQFLLQQWGVEHRIQVAETGIVATIRGSLPGPVMAIRADMDALPIQEANEVAYRSCHANRMHACGHDGHTAIALGTVKLLQQARERLQGSVKVIFQPAEEGPGGAKPMIEQGALRDPVPDMIIGLHLWNQMPLGVVGLKSGPSMAFTDRFELLIEGVGGHGALPHQTVDAIVVGSQVVSALQTVVSRNVDPMQPAVLSIGRFQAGDAFNVIAPQAEIWGTVRSFDPAVADLIPQRLEQLVAGVCAAHGASYRLTYTRNYPAVLNDPNVVELVQGVVQQVLGSHGQVVPEMTMGGEDMSFFLQEVPGCYFFLGSANPAKGLNYPHHHPRFDFDEAALPLGVEIFLGCVERLTGSRLGAEDPP